MKTLANWPVCFALLVTGVLAGCSHKATSPSISGDIRKALDAAGLNDVSVVQDREKGVVTLGGHVQADADKAHAEAMATSLANGDVVADQIAVLPAGAESDARAMNSDLDKGIVQNLDAALIQSKLRHGVEFAVKSRVVTLTGEVDSPSKRREVARVAGTVPNVQQVVNELQVKNQKASSSE